MKIDQALTQVEQLKQWKLNNNLLTKTIPASSILSSGTMAQKALKTLAARNTTTLNRTHLITLALHLLYHLLRLLLLTRSLKPYILCTAPSLLIEIYFERLARPTYTPTSSGTPELKRAGEDLEAKGLTEWMWDVVYWTWGCLVLVVVFGDRVWWLWSVVPAYSVWLVVGTFMGVRKGLGGFMGQGEDSAASGAQSKRQAKMEKRGGQKVAYR